MIWQDVVFIGGNIALAIGLVPMIVQGQQLPLRSTLTTAAVLWAYVLAFGTLGMAPSALATSLTAAGWSVLALFSALQWRGTRRVLRRLILGRDLAEEVDRA